MKLVVFCLRFLSCFALLFVGLAFSQTPCDESDKDAVAAAPVAYVYVSQSPEYSGPNQVLGFAAAKSGRLKPIPGSPFEADVTFMAVNGKYLFGSTTNELSLNTYNIKRGGALSFKIANDISRMTGGMDTMGQTNALALDHTGATLYALRYPVSDNDAYESYTIDKETGALTLTPGFDWGGVNGDGDFTISANDKYFYAVNNGWDGYDVGMSDRAREGTLLQPPPDSPVILSPEPKDGYRFDPIGISADLSNHVAVAFMNMKWDGTSGTQDGPSQIAVYTADARGNLSTASTYKTMPAVSVDAMSTNSRDRVSLKMAPSGKVLAAFGGKGLEVFHFNGADPVTPYASLVQNANIVNAYWDNDNHLYALSAAQTSSTLTFNTANATNVSITGSDGSSYSIGDLPLGFGSLDVSPTVTTTYTISGVFAGGKRASATATVTVNSKPAAREANPASNGNPEPALSITAYPTSIDTFGGLFVYTVTPVAIKEAQGSPYPIPGAQNLIVQSLK